MKIKLPTIGETRIRSGFLFFPKEGNNEIRWLIHATWKEEYHQSRWGQKYWMFWEWVDNK